MKRPGDVVTVADVASEQRLAVGLAKILPGVPVVGEEAVENEPGLRRPDRAGRARPAGSSIRSTAPPTSRPARTASP